MILDGSQLALQDSVYDVAFGSGHIVEINEKTQRFRVQFGQRFFTYTADGHGQFPRKTLFWREPIGGYTPKKHDAKWDTFMRLRDAIAKELGV